MLPLVTWTCGEQPAYMFGVTLLIDGKACCLGFHFGAYVFNVFAGWA